MIYKLETGRLLLKNLCIEDDGFIIELVNTPGWLQFIGDRNVHNKEGARLYISRILSNPDISYLTVTLKDGGTPIGIITMIKRDYLKYPDLGFAFLPSFSKQGFAFEAAGAVLKKELEIAKHRKILAATLKENIQSIRLLEKLGMNFECEIIHGNEPLQIFAKETEVAD